MDAEIGARVRARMKTAAPDSSQGELARRISMTPDAFSRALNGKRAFTAVELVELAQILDTSAHWFVTGETDPFTVKYAGRHTFDHQSMVHEPIDWESEPAPLDDVALAYIQAYGDVPPEKPTIHALRASAVRDKLSDAGDTDFVRHLAELVESEFGIDVVRVDGVSRGYAIEVLGRRVIVIGETGSWFFENWSIAHELSHVLNGELSPKADSACDDPVAEARANKFAADLLLPKSLLTEFDWIKATAGEVADLVWRTGVSTEALRTRIFALGLTVSTTVEQALALKTQTLLRRAWSDAALDEDPITARMQEASARRFPSHLLSAHRAGVADGRLRADTLGWMLGVDVASLAGELAPPYKEVDMDWLAGELGLSDNGE